ncbi:MAG: hypothetical protein ACRDPY_03940 [Streptosporangiaceae bacterium]
MPDTASITDLDARAAVTAGLRALAEFLTVYPAGSQKEKHAEVDRIADVLQVSTEEFGVYQAERRFGGPVAYRAVAVLEPEDAADGPGTA